MKYPFILYDQQIEHAPIFADLTGPPYILDLSDTHFSDTDIDFNDQPLFQKWLDRQMENNHTWGIADYLEPRQQLLKGCPQMVSENRFYHLGIDIIVPLGTALQAPLEGIVHDVGYEEGNGNYGGFVLLKHAFDKKETFYSLYGHLCRTSLPDKGQYLTAGNVFAQIGDFHENGNWFYHTHLQVITEKGIQRGFATKGYAAPQDIPEMQALCPSPVPLFKQ